MHVDAYTLYIHIHSKNYVSKKAKMTCNKLDQLSSSYILIYAELQGSGSLKKRIVI